MRTDKEIVFIVNSPFSSEPLLSAFSPRNIPPKDLLSTCLIGLVCMGALADAQDQLIYKMGDDFKLKLTHLRQVGEYLYDCAQYVNRVVITLLLTFVEVVT